MEGKAIFIENIEAIEEARDYNLQCDDEFNKVNVPAPIDSKHEFLFSVSDVQRAWLLNNGLMLLVFSEVDRMRVEYNEEIWNAIRDRMKLNDKGYRG